ncbi:MAG: hypothetical protein ISS48_04100 [Candidatus Aenigmarchaeota archaeon]|nr:hypothetical protein [Candidatus Aenigmarchaeota archaeon]
MRNLFDYCIKKDASLRTKVRHLVKIGERKKDVARKFNLKYDKVNYWTKDIKKRKYYSPEIKDEVRRRVKNGERKSNVARDMSLNTSTVSQWTSKTGNKDWVLNFTKNQLMVLKDILTKGYTFPTDYNITNIKKMHEKFKRDLPIRTVTIRQKHIYFLDGREDEAFRAFMERYGGKVISYKVLAMGRKCFRIGKN